MTLSQAIIAFFTVWWLVLFAVLPFGVKRVENPDPMHDAGAPEKANIGRKVFVTTIIALALTYAIHLFLVWAPISVRHAYQ